MRIVLAILMLLGARMALATDHTITFVCCSYSPNTLTIAAGDRVIWNGDFTFHPLRQVAGPSSDTPVPGGFAANSGSTFSLVFSTPGTYYYQCTAHGLAQFGGSMRGSFVVVGDDVYANGFE